MKNIQFLVLLLGFTFSLVTNAQTKAFEIIPQIPEPGEQITISYNPELTNLKEATQISGIMYVYDDFKWVIKDISLTKTGIGTWETRVQLPEHAALINCVFNSNSQIDRGGKQSYSQRIEKSAGAFLAWGMGHSAVFQNEIPVKVDSTAFVKDSVALQWIQSEIEHHPVSYLSAFYQELTLNKKVQSSAATNRIKNELRFVLTNTLNHHQQYDVQKTLKLLEGTKDKIFIDSVQKTLIKKYPNGVLARDLALKKIFLQPNLDLKSKQYLAFVQQFPKKDFEDIYTEVENLYNDKIYKAVAYHSFTKYNDYSIIMNSLKEVSFANLIDFSRQLIIIPFEKNKATKDMAFFQTLRMYALSIIPELEVRENRVPKEYREKLSLSQWRQLVLQDAAEAYFAYARILEKLNNYKESQRLLEKIKEEYGCKNTSFNEVYYRMLIRNGNLAQAKTYFELCAKENKLTLVMKEIASKTF
ncbi:tetratricopeptide repeat protein [Flavobacterium flavipallidum]|uniref:Tetratricopeptide repeat protein n=1 Tax=Flavobacterium flavipallidum TaxID=3139140 RepID=A0ABU9HM30_9FLAO